MTVLSDYDAAKSALDTLAASAAAAQIVDAEGDDLLVTRAANVAGQAARDALKALYGVAGLPRELLDAQSI
jgi:hypothetical protein